MAELSVARFETSDYVNNLPMLDKQFKDILLASGIGNPATMQMFLYALLVVPQGVLSDPTYEKLETYLIQLNPYIAQLIESDTSSTYKSETDFSKINYIRHIRNAVAHASCKYELVLGRTYVTFIDRNTSKDEHCSIKMETLKVGWILARLQTLIMEYLISRHP
jgi:hypothetical protein